MAQHLADLGQAPASAQHLGRGRVPQTMRANRRHLGPPARTMHDLRDSTGRQTDIGCPHPREHEHRLAARTPTSKPARQRLTNVNRQRQTLLAAAFEARFTLHHVRRRLPARVRVVAPEHPLTGRELRARHVYRRWGRRWLVLELPDGGVVSVEVEDTDVLEAEPVFTVASGVSTLSSEGARRLLGLLNVYRERLALDAAAGQRGGEGHGV
jgi:hypothetical protein